jgi:hypothetical protein
MARLSTASIMHGASGRVGELIFRQVYGKTVVQTYHEPRVPRSELQRMYNHKMRIASWQARAALANPAVKAHYEKKKKQLNVSSAYTAACTDFLRHGRIDKIDTSKYDKGIITVKAFKADLGFGEVTAKVATRDGKLVAAICGVAKDQGQWFFKTGTPLPRLEDAVITIEAKDKIGNITRVVQEYEKNPQHFHDWRGAPHLGGEIPPSRLSWL